MLLHHARSQASTDLATAGSVLLCHARSKYCLATTTCMLLHHARSKGKYSFGSCRWYVVKPYKEPKQVEFGVPLVICSYVMQEAQGSTALATATGVLYYTRSQGKSSFGYWLLALVFCHNMQGAKAMKVLATTTGVLFTSTK
jgi:hypothetical protein